MHGPGEVTSSVSGSSRSVRHLLDRRSGPIYVSVINREAPRGTVRSGTRRARSRLRRPQLRSCEPASGRAAPGRRWRPYPRSFRVCSGSWAARSRCRRLRRPPRSPRQQRQLPCHLGSYRWCPHDRVSGCAARSQRRSASQRRAAARAAGLDPVVPQVIGAVKQQVMDISHPLATGEPVEGGHERAEQHSRHAALRNAMSNRKPGLQNAGHAIGRPPLRAPAASSSQSTSNVTNRPARALASGAKIAVFPIRKPR